MATQPRGRGPPAWIPAIGLLALLFLSTTASAHANLVSATPSPNTQLDQAPATIELTFSEPLEDAYTGVEVQGPDDQDHVDRFEIHETDRRLATAHLGDLPDGTYTVRWRTLSMADGHTRSGVYFLAINATLAGTGNPDDPGTGPNATASQPGEIPLLEPVFRALGFAGASLAVGLPLFLLVAHGTPLTGTLVRRIEGLTVGGGLSAALAGLGLATQMATRIDGPLTQALATSNGQVLLVRIGLFLAAALIALPVVLGRLDHLRTTLLATATVTAGAGLLATTLGGHAAAATTGLAPAVIVDWLHQVAIGFWIGGVLGLVLAARAGLPEAVGADLVRRFSPLAVASVILVVVTGTISAIDRIPTWEALWGSGYGLTLVAKIVLMAPLVAMGAYHRYVVLPDLDIPGHRARDFRRLQLSAGLEAVGMALVLIAAGLLTSMAPPPPSAGQAPGDGAAGQAGYQPYHTFNTSEMTVEIFITPQPVTVGFQEIFVDITPADPSVNLSEVDVFATFHPPSDPYGEASPKEAHHFYNGSKHFGGALFTEPGTWSTDLSIQGILYAQHTFEVDVQAAQ